MSKLNAEKVIAGASWMIIANISSVLLKFITIPILARMLTPEDFGVVALGMTVVLLLSFLGGKGGLSVALIAQKTQEQISWNSALWANLFIGAVCALLMSVFSFELSVLLGSPRANVFINVLALLIPIQFAVDILNANVLSKLEFKKEAVVSSFSDIIAGIVSLIAAVMGVGAWALILQQFLAQLIRLIAFYFMGRSWLSYQFSFQALRKLFSFSLMSVGVEITNFIAFYAPVIIASKFIGIASSGALSVQSRLSALPGDIILQGISKVLFPMFSCDKLSQQGRQEGLLWSIWVNSILLMPMLLGLAVLGEHITLFVLGEQYIDYWFVLSGLAFSRAIMVPCASFNPYLKATGKIKFLFFLFLFRAVLVTMSGVILSTSYGLLGLMWSIVLSSIISLFVYTPITYFISGIAIKKGVYTFLPALFSAGIMFISLYIMISILTLSTEVELFISIVFGIIIYISFLLLFYKQLRKVRNVTQLKLFFSQYPD